MSSTLIAIDAGTTGVTCLLYDDALTPVARAYAEFEQSFPEPGRVEHHGRAILDAVDSTLAEILAHPRAADAKAIGITNQRETVFPLDPGAGEALKPGIVWQDRRTAERCAELREAGHAEMIAQRTGLVIDPYFSATKIEWMLQNISSLRERCQGGGIVFATVDALIVQHLTEQEVCATDPTNASRTMLFDIERGAWDPELCALFGLEVDWLPEVRPSRGDFGITSRYLCGVELPIRGVVGDQQAALFGQGMVAQGQFKTTFGTGCFLVLNAGAERPAKVDGFLTTLALGPGGESCFALEGSAFMAGAVVQWMRDGLGLIETAEESETVARSVEDTGGVVLVPAFQGLGAPYWDAEARAALLGMTRGTGKAHVVRAGLEAIALQNAELIELLRKGTGMAVEELRVDGGATSNDLLMQLQADFTGAPVVVAADADATARGAALLAGLEVGVLDAGAVPPVALADRFEPTLDAEGRAVRLAEWAAAVARVRSS